MMKNPLKEYLDAKGMSAYQLAGLMGEGYMSTAYRVVNMRTPKKLYQVNAVTLAQIKKVTGVDMIKWIVEYIEERERKKLEKEKELAREMELAHQQEESPPEAHPSIAIFEAAEEAKKEDDMMAKLIDEINNL